MSINKLLELRNINKDDYENFTKLTIMDEKLNDDDLIKICKLTNLNEINLIYNNIYAIPDEISNLKNLKILKINFNYIIKLPPSIIKLQKLYILDLSYNHINILQEEICELSNLQRLLIVNNNITFIPEYISKLKFSLRVLQIGNIGYNNIFNYIVNDFPIIINVKTFENKNNNIIKLPDTFSLLRFLVNFYCNTLENYIYIMEDKMTIIDSPNANFSSLIIPENINDLLIMHINNINKITNVIYDNLPVELEYLRITELQENKFLNNLPINLKNIFIYTTPYANIIAPYSHWTQHLKKEDIDKNIKIPFGCKIVYNDEII